MINEKRIVSLLESIESKLDKLKEYEIYVDENGVEHDDEGNTVDYGREYGRDYGGNVYGQSPANRRGRRRRDYYSGDTYYQPYSYRRGRR